MQSMYFNAEQNIEYFWFRMTIINSHSYVSDDSQDDIQNFHVISANHKDHSYTIIIVFSR